MCSNENAHKGYPEMLCAILSSEEQREKHQNFQKSEHLILENETPSLSTRTHYKILQFSVMGEMSEYFCFAKLATLTLAVFFILPLT